MAASDATSLSGYGPAAREAGRGLPFGLLLTVAWLLLAGQMIAEYWPLTADTLPDADDAMRLVQVRAFLAGQGWFDLHEARLGGAAGYGTHWSRLIDAGIAGLYLMVRPFAGPGLAERLTVVGWPVLWLLPAIAAAAAIAWRCGGRTAAIVALLLAVFAGPGIQQFRPGRIDHHNVQIVISLLIVAATVWVDRSRWAAAVAGLLSGLALAVGFESLPFVVFCGAAMALWNVASREAAGPLMRYALGLAAGTVLAFVASVPPTRWTVTACDMIAANSAAAVLLTAAGLWLAARLGAAAPWHGRLLALTAAGAAGAAAFVLTDPRCIGGHYALIDPAIRPIWLSYVSETQPLIDLFRKAPANALATTAFPLLALAAAVRIARRPGTRHAFGVIAVIAALLLATAYTVTAVRGYSSAIWLGIPFVAAGAVEAFERLRIGNLALRFAILVLATPTAVTVAAVMLASAALPAGLIDIDPPARQACTSRTNYETLARLPRGLVVVNEFEWAPYILAFTRHDVLAAPYHRLSGAILLQHRAFARPPAEARKVLADVGASYLVVCGKHPVAGMPAEAREASLWARLRAGDHPAWLEPISRPDEAAVAIYRVKRE